jgi:hypothetical protein
VEARLASPSYELFTAPESEKENDPRSLSFTDLVYADWAAEGDPPHPGPRTHLTFYRPLPYEGGRGELYSAANLARLTSQFEEALPSVLKAHGVKPEQLRSIHYSRYGHALPLAAPGLLSGGTLDAASAPLEGRLAFANQDNYASPCFESAFAAARAAEAMLRG